MTEPGGRMLTLEVAALLSAGGVSKELFNEEISNAISQLEGTAYADVLREVQKQLNIIEQEYPDNWSDVMYDWDTKHIQGFNAAVGAAYHKELVQEAPGEQPVSGVNDNSAELDLPEHIRTSYESLKPYFEGKPMDGTGQMYASSLALALNVYQQSDCTEDQVGNSEKIVRTSLDKLLGVNTIACGQYPADVAMRLQEIIDKQNLQSAPANQLHQQM